MIALLVAAALGASPDAVLDFYRGAWHCDGVNYRHQRYSLTYRYSVDPLVPPVLRASTEYFIGKRRALLSGQMARTGSGTYVQIGARAKDAWVTSSRGWQGGTLVWTDVLLPGERERDRTTVRRISADSFTEIDQRLGPDGSPTRTNTQATCRRVLGER